MGKGVQRNKIQLIKLNAILENTKAIKEDIQIVTAEKKAMELQKQVIYDKKKEQLKKAQSKFVRVGTKLNEDDFVEFSFRLEYLNLNQSQYIRRLIDFDRLNNVVSVEMLISD